MPPTRPRRALAVAAAIAALLVLVATAGAVRTARTPRTGRIAWKEFLDTGLGTSAIFAANPDGSHRVQLTHPERGVTDDLPDWSPDGSAIIFERIFRFPPFAAARSGGLLIQGRRFVPYSAHPENGRKLRTGARFSGG